MSKFNDSKWRRELINEVKLKTGDHVEVDGEIGVVNKVKGRVAYVKFDSMPGSFHPIETERTKYKGKHKGKDLYISESKELNEFIGFPGSGYALAAVIAFLIKWAKKNPKDVKKLKDKVNKEL